MNLGVISKSYQWVIRELSMRGESGELGRCQPEDIHRVRRGPMAESVSSLGFN